MTDITRLEAIATLLPEGWVLEGEPRFVKAGETVAYFDIFGEVEARLMGHDTNGLAKHYVLHRKRPATVTLEGVPFEVATRLYKSPGADVASFDGVMLSANDAKELQEAAARALEGLKGEA